MNQRITPQQQMNLPQAGSSLPEGHLDTDSMDKTESYYVPSGRNFGNAELQPLLVAAPIANFFNKLSATFQIIFVTGFMLLMVAIPLVGAFTIYKVATESPNFVVIKEQEEARNNSSTEQIQPDDSSSPYRSAN